MQKNLAEISSLLNKILSLIKKTSVSFAYAIFSYAVFLFLTSTFSMSSTVCIQTLTGSNYLANRKKVPMGKSFPFFEFRKNSPYSAS